MTERNNDDDDDDDDDVDEPEKGEKSCELTLVVVVANPHHTNERVRETVVAGESLRNISQTSGTQSHTKASGIAN